jgi:hypothetical protein
VAGAGLLLAGVLIDSPFLNLKQVFDSTLKASQQVGEQTSQARLASANIGKVRIPPGRSRADLTMNSVAGTSPNAKAN